MTSRENDGDGDDKQSPHRASFSARVASTWQQHPTRAARGFAFAFARAAASGAGMRRAGTYKDKVGARCSEARASHIQRRGASSSKIIGPGRWRGSGSGDNERGDG